MTYTVRVLLGPVILYSRSCSFLGEVFRIMENAQAEESGAALRFEVDMARVSPDGVRLMARAAGAEDLITQ